jgi:ribosomal protein S18 acetylase RimI-like enzyme
MATISPGSMVDSGRAEPVIRRAEPAERREALSVLLTGRSSGSRSAVDQFLQFTQAQRLALDELWAAFRGPSPIAAVLIVPSAGGTAMTFLSPTLSQAPRPLHVELIREACLAQDPDRLRLIQALLDPDQHGQRLALEDAGFEYLAELVYMQRSIRRGEDAVDLLSGMDLELTHWTEQHRELFARAIEASYERTLDCPGLLGRRRIEDVIDGHMGTGRFDPQMWFVLHRAGEPAAVMLLNEVTHRQAYELVYLGLSPVYRGQGLGTRMLRYGVAQVAQRRGASLLLAVDQDNTPAVRLYRREGFTATGHKTALLYVR